MAKRAAKRKKKAARRRKALIFTLVALAAAVLVLTLPGLLGKDAQNAANTYGALITLADGHELALELYPDAAPESVELFARLAESGAYDGTSFDMIMPGLLIQDMYTGTETVRGEFSANGFENPLPHERGAVSMGRTGSYDSGAGSFFILTRACAEFDGLYAVFGRVTRGMEIADSIAETGETCVIRSVRVDRNR